MANRHIRVLFVIIVLLGSIFYLPAYGKNLFFKRFYDPWRITGSNTLRFEYYDVSGNRNTSPYKFEDIQPYDELNLNLFRSTGTFSRWRIQFMGLWNNSDYRSSDNGFLLERLNIFHEKGDSFVPYRLEGGDLFGYFSYRTLQRTIKGLELEIQPRWFSINNSIIFLTGTEQTSWRHLQIPDSYSHGVSYLVEAPSIGRWSLNYIYNRRQKDPVSGQPERIQNVMSLTMEKSLKFLTQDFVLESEYGYFKGDHNNTGSINGQNRKDKAFYIQLRGKGEKHYSYIIRYERYGQHYRPVDAASIHPDRKNFEFVADWLSERGLTFRGRYQRYKNNVETTNPLTTRIYGIDLTGPMMFGTTGFLNLSLRDTDDRQRTVDSITKTINVVINKPFSSDLNGRFGIYYQNVNNKIGSDQRSSQFLVAFDKSFTRGDMRGVISPGISYRRVDASVDSRQWVPTLALFLRSGHHLFAYHLSLESQDNKDTSAIDVDTLTNNLRYSYSWRADSINIEYTNVERNPDPGSITKSYRIAIWWKHNLYKPPVYMPEKISETGPYHPVEIDITTLPPGRNMDNVRSILARKGLTKSISLPGIDVYETRVFKEINARQRLAIVHDRGVLTNVAVIIDTGRYELMDTFEQLTRILVDRYGKPTDFYEEGDPSGDIITQVNRGSFIRIREWHRKDGILRLGIPRRIDGQVRIELQYRKKFPPPTDTFWSIEEIR